MTTIIQNAVFVVKNVSFAISLTAYLFLYFDGTKPNFANFSKNRTKVYANETQRQFQETKIFNTYIYIRKFLETITPNPGVVCHTYTTYSIVLFCSHFSSTAGTVSTKKEITLYYSSQILSSK